MNTEIAGEPVRADHSDRGTDSHRTTAAYDRFYRDYDEDLFQDDREPPETAPAAAAPDERNAPIDPDVIDRNPSASV
ncbi:MAG: hypothetical protein ACREIV_05540, partial [Planctomycetaceae bacterium]